MSSFQDQRRRKVKSKVFKATRNDIKTSIISTWDLICHFPGFLLIVSGSVVIKTRIETFFFTDRSALDFGSLVDLGSRELLWSFISIIKNICLRSYLYQQHLRPDTQESVVKKTKLSRFTFHQVYFVFCCVTLTKGIWFLDHAHSTPWTLVVSGRYEKNSFWNEKRMLLSFLIARTITLYQITDYISYMP